MTESIKDEKKEIATLAKPNDNFFGSIVQEIENAMRTWSPSPGMASLFDYNGLRLPLCDIADRGDRYELQVEVPGMSKENVNVKASSHSIEVSAEKSKQTKEKRQGRIYTERSESAFYRQIPLPEEVMPRRVKAQVKNGILLVDIPKRKSSRIK